MVVGRRALQQLAESAGVPAPHAAFSQGTTNLRATDDAAGSSAQRVDQGLPILECDIRYDLTANTRQSDDLSSSVSYVASPHYRVDPVASNSMYRHETAEPRDTWFRAPSAPNNPPLASTSIRPLSTCLTPTCTEAPFAALEVDRFSWSPASDLLIQTVQADLEAAAAMLSSERDNDCQVIAIASSELGEGCTTIAQCLVRTLASADKRVCLIDADFEFPHLAETMGLSPERCLESLLAGEASVSDVLIESLEDGVTLLPLTRPVGSDLVERSKLRQTVMLGELRDHFDVILIDAGRACMPHRPACSILQAGAGIDAVILVRAQDTTRAAWRQAEQSIERWNLHCLGIIENRCAIAHEECA
jgi:Mrp family chromosome partitioning ATPase